MKAINTFIRAGRLRLLPGMEKFKVWESPVESLCA
jgi:hypothetical protein